MGQEWAARYSTRASTRWKRLVQVRSATPPPSTSGLGHHPFKVATRVRIPLGASTVNPSLTERLRRSHLHEEERDETSFTPQSLSPPLLIPPSGDGSQCPAALRWSSGSMNGLTTARASSSVLAPGSRESFASLEFASEKSSGTLHDPTVVDEVQALEESVIRHLSLKLREIPAALTCQRAEPVCECAAECVRTPVRPFVGHGVGVGGVDGYGEGPECASLLAPGTCIRASSIH